MPTPRQIARAETLTRIKSIALEQLAASGASELSLRAIAREIDLVPSAIYRYFDSRDALVTALIIDAYTDLAAGIESAASTQRTPREAWLAAAIGLREWAIDAPHRFLLLYGTPIPGYAAPQTTIEPAASVVRAFLKPLEANTRPAPGREMSRTLATQVATLNKALDVAMPPSAALVAAGAFARAIGLISMEVGGQFVGTFEPASELYAALMDVDADALGV